MYPIVYQEYVFYVHHEYTYMYCVYSYSAIKPSALIVKEIVL